MDLVGSARDARASGDMRELRVVADWLEQQGDPARGALVHMQADLAELEPNDRRAHELRAEIRALVAQHGARWREECPPLPGVEWLEWELGCIASVRVEDYATLCRFAEHIASAGLVDRVELRHQTGAHDEEAHLEFIRVVRGPIPQNNHPVTQLGTALEFLCEAPEITRTKPLARLAVKSDTTGNELAQTLGTAPWAKRLVELELPTGHDGTDTGYYGDPRLRDVTPLTKLVALEKVVLDKQPITGAGITKLCKKLPKLRELSVRG
ncbi:MAG TPA: hypothetical protein VGC41_07825, partial [Kofleriaceae bacterium]